jgi:hypothetical protein
MDSSVYDIYFQGEALEGFDINLVKQNMAKLFQANAQTLTALFSGKTVLLKKDLAKDDALKYQTLLKKAGAKIVIKARRVDAPAAGAPTQPASAQSAPQPQAAAKPSTPPPTAPPQTAPTMPATTAPMPKVPDTPASQSTARAASGVSTPSWSLSPAGSDLLKPEERHEAAAPQIDTSALSVAAPSPLPQVQKAEPPPPDTSSLSIAAVGTMLGTGERDRANAQAIVPDVNFDIAEVGARLAEESIEIPLPEPDLSQFSVAAVGSRLATESKEPPPKAPDTSHLSVAPQK